MKLFALFLFVIFLSCSPTYVVQDPPLDVEEVIPARPRGEVIWVKGHHVWRKGRWVWVSGHWQKARHGRVWVAGHWKKTPRGWVWVDGHWRR